MTPRRAATAFRAPYGRDPILVLFFAGLIMSRISWAEVAPSDEPSTPGLPIGQVLGLGTPPALPSGWEPLLDEMNARSEIGSPAAHGLFAWDIPRLLPAIRERASSIQRLTHDREWDEAAGTSADLRRLALHLIERYQHTYPSPETTALNRALRIEVLSQSLEESCAGENRGRAKHYAREIANIAEVLITGKEPPVMIMKAGSAVYSSTDPRALPPYSEVPTP